MEREKEKEREREREKERERKKREREIERERDKERPDRSYNKECYDTKSVYLYLFHPFLYICAKYGGARLYGLALNERIEKLLNFKIHFHRSGKKTFDETIICSIILFIIWSFSFLSPSELYKP